MRCADLDIELAELDLARLLVLQPRQQAAQECGRRRNDAGRVARMDALRQHAHREGARRDAAPTTCEPHRS